MDGIQNPDEKRWFLKIDQQHAGPFSFNEIRQKMALNLLTESALVRGMNSSEWIPVMDLFAGKPSGAPSTIEPAVLQPTSNPEELSALIILKPNEKDTTRQIDTSTLKTAKKEEKKALKTEIASTQPGFFSRMFKTIMQLFVLAIIVLAGVAGYMAYKKFFPAFANPTDLDEKTTKQMLEIIKIDPKAKGTKVMLSLSRNGVLKPVFHLATNLTDGAEFELIFSPNPASMTQPSPGPIIQKVKTVKHHATTQPIEYPNSIGTPIGDYQIEIFEMPEHKSVLKMSSFLGGTKTKEYYDELKQYHEKLKAEYIAKFNPFKDVPKTLEGLMNETLNNKLMASRKPNPKMKSQFWGAFNTKFSGKLNQLSEYIESLKSKEDLKSYKELVQLTTDTALSIQKLHEMHHQSFTQKIDPKIFNLQLSDQIKETKNKIESYKNRFESVMKNLENLKGYIDVKHDDGANNEQTQPTTN